MLLVANSGWNSNELEWTNSYMDEMNIKTSHLINFSLNLMILKIAKFSKKQKEAKLVKFTLEKNSY
jgi:hypothetical protein